LSIGAYLPLFRAKDRTLTALLKRARQSGIANNVRLRECPPPIAGAFSRTVRTLQ